MASSIAGIDVHKRVLMVVVSAADERQRLERRRFGATALELDRLAEWLQEHGVEEAVMESTAQYWKPVWMALEDRFRLHLAQAWSNRAPRGKKTDFKDAERLVRRYRAHELTLSFVPDAEQRLMRTLTRRRAQLLEVVRALPRPPRSAPQSSPPGRLRRSRARGGVSADACGCSQANAGTGTLAPVAARRHRRSVLPPAARGRSQTRIQDWMGNAEMVFALPSLPNNFTQGEAIRRTAPPVALIRKPACPLRFRAAKS